MSNELIVFEGINIEFVTKEDVNFEFNGTALFHGNQTAGALGYKDTNDAVNNHVEDENKYLVTKEKLKGDIPLSLGQRGNWFIDEDGVIDMTYKSKLPQATDFRKKVREVIKQVQATGRYDAVENKLMEVEDTREKQLKLKVYKLEQLLEIDPSDRFTQILLNDAQKDLAMHQQQLALDEVKTTVQTLTEKVEKVQEQNTLIQTQQLQICNRTNFDERIKMLANKYFGRDMQKAYTELFEKMKLLGSFDVLARRRNEWEKINAERAKEDKKPYKASTLKQKYNNLDVIDAYHKWELASEAYKMIETENCA